MRIDVWSDVVCPWCFLGKRRLDRALAAFDEPVEVVFHAFSLDPSSPTVDAPRTIDRLSARYGVDLAQAQAMIDRVAEAGRSDGVTFDFASCHAENTRTAHRMLAEAGLHGVQATLMERLFQSYFCEGGRLSDDAHLVALAVAAGVPSDEAQAVIDDPSRHAAAFDQDLQTAQRLGIRGVPFFVIDQKLGVSGAQSPEVLRQAFAQARG
jgi:predicted DsbA family dithiol-disulfide isomerase